MFKIVLAFACLALLETVSGWNCYSCMSVKDPDCAEAPGNNHVVQCSQLLDKRHESFCLKKISKDHAGKETVIRKCVAALNKDFSTDCSADPSSEILYCDGCSGDLCNSATTTKITFLGVATAISVFFFTYQF